MPTVANNSLVSYNAPASSTTTFYLSTLDEYAQADVMTSGVYQGETSVQNQVSYKAITEMVNINYATCATWFKFKTIENDGDLNSVGNGIIGMKGEDSAFTAVSTAGGVPAKAKPLKSDYLNTLAEYVFGNREVADFFTNQEALKNAWDSAKDAATENINDAMTGTAFAESVSMELVKTMLVNNAERFALEYNAVLDVPAMAPVADEHGLAIETVTGTGSGASVTILADSTDYLKQIVVSSTVNTAANGTQTTSYSFGSGYANGDQVRFTMANGGKYSITLNAVQAAILNGVTDSVGANPPLLPGDKIRVKYSIHSPSDQTDTTGSPVSFTQSFYVDYLLQA